MGYNLNMNNFYSFNMPEEYTEAVKNQPFIPGQDFVPRIINNLFTDEEVQSIKKDFDTYPMDKIKVQGHNGMGNLDIDFSQKRTIIEKVEKLVSDICGEEVEVLEANPIKYNTSFGWFVKFAPHYDARPVEMFVLDYHVQGNDDWSVFVEGKEFAVNDNDALLFNGTGQVHWREQKQLKEDTNIDIILFWIQHKNPKPVSKQHTETMRERAGLALDMIDPPPTLTREDWWKSIKVSDAALSYPDVKKISAEHRNPLSHNTIYDLPANVTREDIRKISLSGLNGAIDAYKEIIEHVTTFMVHVHAESEIEYLDTRLIRYDNNSRGLFENTDKELVSLAVVVDSSNKTTLIVDDESFTMEHFSTLTLSPSNQDISIKIKSDDPNSFAEILTFNFWLKEIY